MNPHIGDLRITVTIDIPRLGWLPHDMRGPMVERDIRDAVSGIVKKVSSHREHYTQVEMREVDLKRGNDK